MDDVGDDLEAKVVILGDSGVGTASHTCQASVGSFYALYAVLSHSILHFSISILDPTRVRVLSESICFC